MDRNEKALELHRQWKGKIRVTTPCKLEDREDLSLAYTPGVAAPCLEIQKDVEKSYDLTRRHNLCAVITDGSAVLGLGDIGPEKATRPARSERPKSSSSSPWSWVRL